MQPDQDVINRWSDAAPFWEKHREIIRQMFAPVTAALTQDGLNRHWMHRSGYCYGSRRASIDHSFLGRAPQAESSGSIRCRRWWKPLVERHAILGSGMRNLTSPSQTTYH